MPDEEIPEEPVIEEPTAPAAPPPQEPPPGQGGGGGGQHGHKPEKIPWIDEHVVHYNPPQKIRVYQLNVNIQLGPPPYFRVDMRKTPKDKEDPYRWIPLTGTDGKPVLYWSLAKAIELGLPRAEAFMETEDWENIPA